MPFSPWPCFCFSARRLSATSGEQTAKPSETGGVPFPDRASLRVFSESAKVP